MKIDTPGVPEIDNIPTVFAVGTEPMPNKFGWPESAKFTKSNRAESF